MKRIFKSFLSMFLLVITLSFLTSCLTRTPGVATLTYKKEAQDKMEYYFSQYKTGDYTVDNWTLIVELYEDSLVDIKKSNLIEEVDGIITTTVNKMNEVVKIDYVQIAKDEALANWEALTQDMLSKEAEYSSENFELVKQYLEEGIATINGAISVEGVKQSYEIAKDRVLSVDNLKDENEKYLTAKKEEAIKAINEYYETFDSYEYTFEGELLLQSIIASGIKAINAATEIAELETIVENTKASMDEVELRPRYVHEAKRASAGEVIKVEGIVIGYGGNGTWSEILILDTSLEKDIIGVKSTKTYEKGDLIRFTATVAVSDNETEYGKKYLKDPTDIEVVSSNNDHGLALSALPELKTQEDLAAIPYGSEYTLYKFSAVNMYGNMYESKKDYSKAYYRVSFNKDATELDDIKIKNEQGTYISIGFRVNYIAKNLGDGWTEKWFGQTEYESGGYPGHVFSGSVYALYVGGNGYYAQFTILEDFHIQPNVEMQEGRANAYADLAELVNSYDVDRYLPENYKVIEELNVACKELIKHATTVEEMNNAVANAKAEMDKVEKIKVVKNVDLVIPTKTTYEQYEAINLEGGKAVVVFDDETTYEIELNSDHVTSFSSDVVGAAVVILKISFNDAEYVLEYNIEVTAAEKPITVSEVKAKAKDEEVFVEGIVIGKCGNGTWQEILIKDFVTMDIIGLKNSNGINVNTSAQTGDIIRFNAKVTESDNQTELGKLYLTYVDGLSVVSENNQITYDLEQAVSITTQDELASFVVSGKDNAYKLVKVSGDIYANTYGDTFSSMYFRFHLNAEATGLSKIKVNNESGTAVSAALRNSYVSGNIGSDWTNDVFGVTEAVSGTYPGIKFSGTIYMLFAGGNKYYAQFTILDASHIVKA